MQETTLEKWVDFDHNPDKPSPPILHRWLDFTNFWPLFYFDVHDTFNEDFWAQKHFEKSKNMLMCHQRPTWVYNLAEGSHFVGSYWCRDYLCSFCGPVKRDRRAAHIRKQLYAEVEDSGSVYLARCQVAEYQHYRVARYRAGADCYTIHRGSESKYIFANRDFRTRRYRNKSAVECHELYEEDFDDALCEALRLPENLNIRPGGNWPPLPPERSPWKYLSYAHLLEREQIEEIEKEETDLARIKERLEALIRECRAEEEPWRHWVD